MDTRQLLSDNITTIAAALKTAIDEDRSSKAKEKARIGKRYYEYEHDILENRIFYIDDNDVIREDAHASNVKIPHAFFTEQVDQKVQYLLSNPIAFETEDEQLQTLLEEYYDEDFQLFLQEALEGASKKGFEYVFARTNSDDRLTFQVADSIQTFAVYDDMGDVKRIVRYYDKDTYEKGKKGTVTIAELWDEQQVTFFTKSGDKPFILDESREMNPRPHVLAKDSEGKLLQRAYETIPFYRLSNNSKELSDLEPIKALIDDYDLMACYLSNNLQDFSEAIYVVKGFRGDDLSKLRQNIKAKKTVGVGSDGGVDIQTVEIPTEARKTKLGIDKEAIYKFGMAFDSSQMGDGNITNVVIKSRYALLDMKCNKAEVRLRAMLKWINSMVAADINRRNGTAYKASDIEMTITRETMVNENDIVANAKIEAETKALIIQAILAAAPRLDDESVLKLICEQYDLDWEEVQQLLEEQDYTPGLQADTDPIEGEPNGAAGQVE